MDRKESHFDKYERIAHILGIDNIKAIIPMLDCKDVYLNGIPLKQWDLGHDTIFCLYKQHAKEISEKGGWSLANSVCVMKHVARYHDYVNMAKEDMQLKFKTSKKQLEEQIEVLKKSLHTIKEMEGAMRKEIIRKKILLSKICSVSGESTSLKNMVMSYEKDMIG